MKSLASKLAKLIFLSSLIINSVSANTILTEDLQLNIPWLSYQTPSSEDMLFWANLNYMPTNDGSFLFEVDRYGNYNGPLQPTEEGVVLTPDWQLHIPFVTYQQSDGDSFWWANLGYQSTDADKIVFKVKDYGQLEAVEKVSGVVAAGFINVGVEGATVEFYDREGNRIGRYDNATNADGTYDIAVPEESENVAYVKTYGGKMVHNSEPFQGEMVALCSQANIQSCNITPYSSVVMRLSALYSDTRSADRKTKAKALIKDVLGFDKDPGIYKIDNPEELANIDEWITFHGDGTGIANWYDRLASDIVDGYLDDADSRAFLIGAEQRPVVTETVAIDQTNLEQQLVDNPLIVSGTLKMVSFSEANDLSGTEDQIKHEDYLSGYAAIVERTTEDTEVSTDIVYNAFHVGDWKGKLNAETTTLYQIFITEPDLLFLPRSEQKTIAEKLAAQDEFTQAVELYEAELSFSESAAPGTRSNLIAELAEHGIALLFDSQRQGVRKLLGTRVATARKHFSSMEEQQRSTRSKSDEKTLPINPVVSSDGKVKMFTIFDGMRVMPLVTIGGVLNLEFYSNMSLWYALFDSDDFSSEKTSWYQHALDAPLITPKSGWLDFETVTDYPATYDINAKRTRMPVANIVGGELAELNKPANWKVYRNNPYSWVDAPQLMNTLTVANVALEAASGFGVLKVLQDRLRSLSGVGKFIKASDAAMEKLETIRYVKPFLQATWEFAKVACEEFDGLSVTTCNQRFGNLEALKSVIDAWPEPLASDSRLPPFSHDNEKQRGEVKHQLLTLFKSWGQNPKGNKLKFFDKLKQYSKTVIDKKEIIVFLVEKLFVTPNALSFSGMTASGLQTSEEVGSKVGIIGNKLSYEGKKLSNRDIAQAIVNVFFKEGKYTEKDARIRNALFFARAKNPINSASFYTDFYKVLKASAIISNFYHNISNLRESVTNVDSSSVSQVFMLIVNHLLTTLQEKGKEFSAELLQKAMLSLTPARVVKILSAANQGTAMAWDWMTAPSVVNFKIVRTEADELTTKTRDDKTPLPMTLTFNTPPKMSAVRYLSVEKDYKSHLLQVESLASNIKGTKKWLLPTNADKDANHLLVVSGFTASVENHAIFAPDDKAKLKALMNENAVTTDWHVYRFKQLPNTEVLPISRNASNAFNNNYRTCDTDSKLCIKNTTTYKKGGDNLLLNEFMNSKPDFVDKGIIFKDSIEYIDFTQAYGENLLIHKTPGVFSDTTRFYVGKKDGDVYANTFNVYVLPNYKNGDINKALKQQSLLFTNDDQKALHLKLVRGNDNYWEDIKVRPFYVIIKTIIDGKNRWLGPQEIYLNNKEGEFVPLPNKTSIDDTRVYVYDAILETWRQNTGRSILRLLSTSNTSVSPWMDFSLKEFQSDESGIEIEIQDTDGDGIADKIDLWPNDPRYAVDSDGDGLADNWEEKYGLSIQADNANKDHDNDGYTNLQEFEETLALGTNEIDVISPEHYSGPESFFPHIFEIQTTVPSEHLRLEITTQPQHGESEIDGLNVTYTPEQSYIGTDSFDFVVKTKKTGIVSEPTTISITVTTNARLNHPYDLTIDDEGNLYIANSYDHRILKADTDGIATVFAGSGKRGYDGDGDLATKAQLNRPIGVAFDSIGQLYIIERENARIRRVNTDGTIDTIAGNGSQQKPETLISPIPATEAELPSPRAIVIDADDNIYLSDTSSYTVSKIYADGGSELTPSNAIIDFMVGIGDNSQGVPQEGDDATMISLQKPEGIAVDSQGHLYIADYSSNLVFKVEADNTIKIVAGGGNSNDNTEEEVQATSIALSNPADIAFDSQDNLYILETGKFVVRKVDTKGIITTVAGNGTQGHSGDGGWATEAQFGTSYGIAIDNNDNLYIADHQNNAIRKVKKGIITTVIGNKTVSALWNHSSNHHFVLQDTGPKELSLSGNTIIDKSLELKTEELYHGSVRILEDGLNIRYNPYKSSGIDSFEFYTFDADGEVTGNPLTATIRVIPFELLIYADLAEPFLGENLPTVEYNTGDTMDTHYNAHVHLKSGTLDLADKTVTIDGHLIQSGGDVKINGGKLIVKGDYRIQTKTSEGDYTYSTGRLFMQNTDDKVSVNGDFVMDSSIYHSGYLKAGTLEVKGDFTQKSSYDSNNSRYNFHASGTHTVMLGDVEQTIHFEDRPQSQFQRLELTSNLPIIFEPAISVVEIKPDMEINSNIVIDNTVWKLRHDHVILGDLELKGATLDLNGKTLKVAGNVLQSGGDMRINGGTLEIGGDYHIQNQVSDGDTYSTGRLFMQNTDDKVSVNGDFVMDSSIYHSGYLKAGTLEVKGDFTQKSSYDSNNSRYNFHASGTHTVMLSPTSSVSFEDEQSGFNNEVVK